MLRLHLHMRAALHDGIRSATLAAPGAGGRHAAAAACTPIAPSHPYHAHAATSAIATASARCRNGGCALGTVQTHRSLHTSTQQQSQSQPTNADANPAEVPPSAAAAAAATDGTSDAAATAAASERARRGLIRAHAASLRYERARTAAARTQQKAQAKLHQPAGVSRLCQRLERLSLRMRDRFPVRRSELRGSVVRQRLQADPQWAEMHAEGAEAMGRVMTLLRQELDRPPAPPSADDEASSPDEVSQLSARQWQVLVLACKNLGLESCALGLYALMREHFLHPLRDSPRYALLPDSLRRLEEREVNVLIDCIGHDVANLGSGDGAATTTTPEAGQPNGSSSSSSSSSSATELAPLPTHGGPHAALHVLRDMQHPLLADHFVVTGSTSGVALVALAAASPAPAAEGASPSEVAATSVARSAHLESVRAHYAVLPCKDGYTHSAMLGIYLAAGEHASMRSLLASLDAQSALLVAGCMGAMLSSVHAQLEQAPSGSDLAVALLHAAERYWRRAKQLPDLNASLTLTMMRVCALMWDPERQQTVLDEAIKLEQEHEAIHLARMRAATAGGKPAASATKPHSSPIHPKSESALVPSAPHHSLGYLYATPACFGLLFHTLATRTSFPGTALPAAQAAWASMQQRHARAKEAGLHERERALRVDLGTADSYSRLLHRAQQSSGVDALQIQMDLWQSLPLPQRFGPASRPLLIRLLGQMPPTPDGWAQADRLATDLDAQGYPWSSGTLTALLRAFQRLGAADDLQSSAEESRKPPADATTTTDAAAIDGVDASAPVVASASSAPARTRTRAPRLADRQRGAAAWSRFERLGVRPTASAYCAYMQLLIRAGGAEDLKLAETMWAEVYARERASARSQRSALRRGLSNSSQSGNSNGPAGLFSSAPSRASVAPRARAPPPPGLRFHSGHMGALVKAARATGRKTVLRRWTRLALEAGYAANMDHAARNALKAPTDRNATGHKQKAHRSADRPRDDGTGASRDPSAAGPAGELAGGAGDAAWLYDPAADPADVVTASEMPAAPLGRSAARNMRRKKIRLLIQAARAKDTAAHAGAVGPVELSHDQSQ